MTPARKHDLKACVWRSMKFSQSMKDVAADNLADATARLINALLTEVVMGKHKVDWTTLKVVTRKVGTAGMWETIVSVEEREK